MVRASVVSGNHSFRPAKVPTTELLRDSQLRYSSNIPPLHYALKLSPGTLDRGASAPQDGPITTRAVGGLESPRSDCGLCNSFQQVNGGRFSCEHLLR
jgi:hypothetical protein